MEGLGEVEAHRQLAGGALRQVAAIAAEHEPGRAAPVDEQDRLLAPLERDPQRPRQGKAEDAPVPGTELIAHVHHGHLGQAAGGGRATSPALTRSSSSTRW